MSIQEIAQLPGSSLPAKLFITVCMAAVFLRDRKRDPEGFSSDFLYLFALQALRDILYVFFPAPEIYVLSDLFVLTAFAFLVSSPSGGRWFTAGLAGVNLCAAVLFVSDWARPFLPAFWASAFSFVPLADAVAAAAFLGIRARDRKRPVRKGWNIDVGFAVLYAAAGAFLGRGSQPFHLIAVPLFYLWPLSTAISHMESRSDELVRALDYYEGILDSVYNLSTETGAALKGSFSMSDMLDGLIRSVATETGANGGAVLLVDEFEDALAVRSVYGEFPPPFKIPDDLPRRPESVDAYVRSARFKLGESLFGEVARTGKDLFVPSAQGDDRVADNGKELFLQIGSLIVVPLMKEDTVIGVLAVERLIGYRHFSETEFDRCKTLANFGALQVHTLFAFQEARERGDLQRPAQIAAEIQGIILPKNLPEFGKVSLGARMVPAIGVNGDYFDVIQTRRDRVLLAVGDMAGKGLASALVMVMVRSILHLVAHTDKSVATMLSWINRGVTGEINIDHYATLGLLSVNLVTGELEYANASHQSPLVYRADAGAIESVEMKSIPIGVERGTVFPQETLRLKKGDILLMYTDGVVEAMNGQGKQFGRKNLGLSLMKSRDLPARDIAARVHSDLAEFIGEARRHDDQTVFVMKMK